jgi:mRNA interferase MazF
MTSYRRGDVVLLEYPFSDGVGSKRRPSLVVQSDAYNATISKTIVAMITGNLRRQHDPAHVLLDPLVAPSIGLNGQSLVSCHNIYTVDQSSILRRLGALSPGVAQVAASATCAARAARGCSHRVVIGVGTAHWFGPPRPPNRTGRSPASGSPVDGLPS